MVFKYKEFEVIFTKECVDNITDIYNYISFELKENGIAKQLLKEVKTKIINLAYFPNMYIKIGKTDKLKRNYHRMVIKNYIVLYTIDYKNKKVFVSRMIYGKRNFLN